MSLILEVYKPLFGIFLTAITRIDLNGYDDGTCIDLIGNFHIGENAVLLELLHCHKREIHEADEFVLSVSVDILAGIEVAHISCLKRCPVISFCELNILKLGSKSSMSAMI